MRIRLYHSKSGLKEGKPWMIKTSRGCFPASHVFIQASCQTEEKPTTGAYSILVEGKLNWSGSIATITS